MHKHRKHIAALGMATAVVWAASSLLPQSAHAHCQPPEVKRPMVRPSAPTEIELYMNFGSAISTDDGKSWRLQCEEVYQDPAATSGPNQQWLMPNGSLALAHSTGLLVLRDQGCGFERATGTPKDKGGTPIPVIDLALDAGNPDKRLWLAIDDGVYRSDDGGATVTLARRMENHYIVSVVTPSAGAGVVYLTSVASGDQGSTSNFISTTDGFATAPMIVVSPFGSNEIKIRHVSASTASTIYFTRRTEQINDEGGDEKLYVSRDRGRAPALIFDPVVSAGLKGEDARLFFAAGATAGELWVAVAGNDKVADAGALFHSTDDGKTWSRVTGHQPHFRCLEFLRGQLWSCGNNAVATGDTFALGASTDGGRTWQKKFAFGELCTALQCATDKCAPVLSSNCVPGLCTQPPDAGTGADAATGSDGGDPPPPKPSGGCGDCSAGASSPLSIGAAILALAAIVTVTVTRRRASSRSRRPGI